MTRHARYGTIKPSKTSRGCILHTHIYIHTRRVKLICAYICHLSTVNNYFFPFCNTFCVCLWLQYFNGIIITYENAATTDIQDTNRGSFRNKKLSGVRGNKKLFSCTMNRQPYHYYCLYVYIYIIDVHWKHISMHHSFKLKTREILTRTGAIKCGIFLIFTIFNLLEKKKGVLFCHFHCV
jgi:hypothetical protein